MVAIDPGTTKSAYVAFDSDKFEIIDIGIVDNNLMVEKLELEKLKVQTLLIEMLKSYGNVMGDNCLLTCVWVGRFIQTWGDDDNIVLVPRKTIVTELCQNPRAKDSNVRQALINRFCDEKNIIEGSDTAIGKKASPGPLYGVKKDMWSALALAVAYIDIKNMKDKKLNALLS